MEVGLAVVAHDAPDVVAVGVRGQHAVDILGIDTRRLETRQQLALRGPEHGRRAHAGIDQKELVARVDDKRVLLEHGVVRRQEIVGQHLADLVLACAEERTRGVAERNGTVRHHCCLHLAVVEAVEVGSLFLAERRLGDC